MAWIKRNLFFVIGGVVAIGLLGAAGFYNYKSWTQNSAALDKLNEICDTLKNLAAQKPAPGNAKINNIETAKQQELQVHEWIRKTAKYFQPIAPIPNTGGNAVSSEAFAAALRKTVDQLQHEATAANVMLPPDYVFSFLAERPVMRFSPNSLALLPTQLGEVKALSEVIFDARVNALDSIQRVRVADEDVNGSQSDYIDDHSVTNDLAVLTPYVITFRSFSPEIAQVLEGFASSKNGFIVNGINVQPAGNSSSPATPGGGMPMMAPMAAQPTMMTPTPARGGLQTVLNEQLLRVTIEVEVVKLLPKN